MGLSIAAAVAAGAPSGAAADPGPAAVVVQYRQHTAAAARSRAPASARPGMVVVAPAAGESVADAVDRLRRDPAVAWAEPDVTYRALDTGVSDPLFHRQWSLNNTGQTGDYVQGTPGDDVHAVGAWAQQNDAAGVTVAVVDSGVDADAPDLRGQVLPGADFVDPGGNGDADPNGHGTGVATLLAAQHGDGFGLAGLAGGAQILPVRALNPSGVTDAATLASALAWAGRHAKIVNVSIGGPYSAAVATAIHDTPGALFVVAAGNDHEDEDRSHLATFPCNDTAPNVVCVTASDEHDARAWFSNFGRDSVDLAAPGVRMQTPVPDYHVLVHEGFEQPLNGAWQLDGFSRSQAHPGAGGWALETVPRSTPEWQLPALQATASVPVDFTGHSGCQLRVYVGKALAFEPTVHIGFRITDAGGGRGGGLLDPVGSVPELMTVALPDGLGPSTLTLEAGDQADTTPTDHLDIDDLVVRCADGATTYPAYDTQSGTSLAAPLVAGAAALRLAAHPAEDPLQLRSVLTCSTDPVPALEGLVATSGRLDAAAALRQPTRAVTRAAVPSVVPWAGNVGPAFTALAALTDGSIVIETSDQERLERIAPDGTRTPYAGVPQPRVPDDTGNGGPAVNAHLTWIEGIAGLPDGGLAIADWSGIRRVLPDGTITQLYADPNDNFQIRDMAANGRGEIVTTLDWGDLQLFGLDGSVRTLAHNVQRDRLAFLDDDHLVTNHWTDGTIHEIALSSGRDTTIAGSGYSGDSGDGGSATAANMDVGSLAQTPEGLVVEQRDGHDVYRLRRIDPQGRIWPFVGTSVSGDTPASGSGDTVPLGGPVKLVTLPSGAVAFIGGHTALKVAGVALQAGGEIAPQCDGPSSAEDGQSVATSGSGQSSVSAPLGPSVTGQTGRPAGRPQRATPRPRVSARLRAAHGRMMLMSLRVWVPRDSALTIACQGAGCPRQPMRLAPAPRARLVVTRAWRRFRLKAGDRLIFRWRPRRGSQTVLAYRLTGTGLRLLP